MLVRFGNKSNKLSDIESQNFGCVLNCSRVKRQDEDLAVALGRIGVKFRIKPKCNIQSVVSSFILLFVYNPFLILDCL